MNAGELRAALADVPDDQMVTVVVPPGPIHAVAEVSRLIDWDGMPVIIGSPD